MSSSELSDSDVELQNALVEGKLKPGLNTVEEAKNFVNNVGGLKQKLEEMKLDLPWIERLDCINKQAPLAPELAASMLTEESKRENQLKNNKKLPQLDPSEDPVLNDFKRETSFYRQAQSAVMEAIERLKSMGIATKRPDDYFAEMAKTDEHMQKIREHLMKRQEQQKRSERVKQLRQQRKEGKIIQLQTKLQRQQEKKEMLNQVKKVRKGVSKDLGFLDGKNKSKSAERRKMKDKKFGFGGKKRGLKQNTKDSAADISEYRSHSNSKKKGRSGKNAKQRPGKNKRIKIKAKGKRKNK